MLALPEALPIVLASASRARARLLEAAGVPVAVRPVAVDEAALRESLSAEGVTAGDAAVALAELKAQRVASQAGDAIVLGADQILTCEGRWFDKPGSPDQARLHLQQLAGRRHELWTAAVAFRGGTRIWHHVASNRLWMRDISADFIGAYLERMGERALASVGAYEVEGVGGQLFARIEGDHFAIQGLPLLEVLEMLRQQGVLSR
jgi:septum formation protein